MQKISPHLKNDIQQRKERVIIKKKKEVYKKNLDERWARLIVRQNVSFRMCTVDDILIKSHGRE